MKSIYFVVAVGIVAVMAGGCATIITGTHQTITVNSNPPDAKVDIGGMQGVTPATFELKRNTIYTITISKEGYQTQKIVTNKPINLWIIGNIIFWPAVIVDLIDSAAWKIEPSDVNVTLTKSEGHAEHMALPKKVTAITSRADAPKTQ